MSGFAMRVWPRTPANCTEILLLGVIRITCPVESMGTLAITFVVISTGTPFARAGGTVGVVENEMPTRLDW